MLLEISLLAAGLAAGFIAGEKHNIGITSYQALVEDLREQNLTLQRAAAAKESVKSRANNKNLNNIIQDFLISKLMPGIATGGGGSPDLNALLESPEAQKFINNNPQVKKLMQQ